MQLIPDRPISNYVNSAAESSAASARASLPWCLRDLPQARTCTLLPTHRSERNSSTTTGFCSAAPSGRLDCESADRAIINLSRYAADNVRQVEYQIYTLSPAYLRSRCRQILLPERAITRQTIAPAAAMYVGGLLVGPYFLKKSASLGV